jgi:hypothetical protein
MRVLRMAVAIGCVAVLVACGSDSGDDFGSPATSGSSSDDGGSTDGSAAAGLVPEDCQFLLAGAFVNPMASAVPGAGGTDVEQVADQLDAIAAQAPSEIQDAMALLSESYAAIAEVMAGIDMSNPASFADPEVQQQFDELDETFDDEYEAASQAVSDYVEENCSGG